MKANELMLGDWVYSSELKKFPMQVEGIFTDTLYLNFDENEGEFWEVYAKDIKPIPLTKDLLESLMPDRWTEFTRDDKGSWNIDILGLDASVSGELKYVHQFQQALRLCGYYNLADNLKL